ncbi:MAG: type VI secretion system contractile sheath small subunit [Desulfobacterota bacterium]|nr:type VI secretion system contractile sheath small subunit [Thermodesulfobacteriota bacterium]
MPKEASVAPKERINIVYRPATGDVKEDVELPLKILIMGDFTGRPDDRPLEKRDPINIDKDNFNEVLKSQGLSLNLAVPNRLSGKPDEEMTVKLQMKSLKDFEPESIVQQVPELKRLLELREALRALRGPLANIPEFRKKVQELIQDESTRKQLLKEMGIGE